MNDSDFIPTIYIKQGCPFCLKLRLFLLETGLLDMVTLVEGADAEEHRKLVDHLTSIIGKASFPTAEIAPGEYLADSDALIAHFTKIAGTDLRQLPTYQAYVGGVMPRLQQLYLENIELKKQRG